MLAGTLCLRENIIFTRKNSYFRKKHTLTGLSCKGVLFHMTLSKTYWFFNIKIFDAKNPPQEMSIPICKSEDLPHGIGGEARVMSPRSVGQGCWGPLNEDNRFR